MTHTTMARPEPPITGEVLVRQPFDDVVLRVETALHRHGFVAALALDLDRDLLVHVGAHMRPYRVLLVHNPATTQRILRQDPAAADRVIVMVTIRDTGDGAAVSVPEPSRPIASELVPVIDRLRQRMRATLRAEDRP